MKIKSTLFDKIIKNCNFKKSRKIGTQFEIDCEMFRTLIDEGKKLEKKAPSVRGFVLDNSIEETEKEGFKWFVKTRNFLIELFGENSKDVKSFTRCFRRYSTENLMGLYCGEIVFVKEDLRKAIGILEGIYELFLEKKVKRRNKLVLWLSKIYYELKDWIFIFIRGKKNDG